MCERRAETGEVCNYKFKNRYAKPYITDFQTHNLRARVTQTLGSMLLPPVRGILNSTDQPNVIQWRTSMSSERDNSLNSALQRKASKDVWSML